MARRRIYYFLSLRTRMLQALPRNSPVPTARRFIPTPAPTPTPSPPPPPASSTAGNRWRILSRILPQQRRITRTSRTAPNPTTSSTGRRVKMSALLERTLADLPRRRTARVTHATPRPRTRPRRRTTRKVLTSLQRALAVARVAKHVIRCGHPKQRIARRTPVSPAGMPQQNLLDQCVRLVRRVLPGALLVLLNGGLFQRRTVTNTAERTRR